MSRELLKLQVGCLKYQAVLEQIDSQHIFIILHCLVSLSYVFCMQKILALNFTSLLSLLTEYYFEKQGKGEK